PIKSVSEKLEEAMSRIPSYNSKWTNYNISDPGITILELLSGVNTLQESELFVVPYEVRLRLFALAGISPKKSKSAKVLLSATGLSEAVMLPTNQRFTLGDMVFETSKMTKLYPSRVERLLSKKKGSDTFSDYSFVLDRETTVPGAIFGDDPVAGDELYLFTDSLPDPGTEMIFYFGFSEMGKRNPLEERKKDMFAKIKWECYTKKGFVEIESKDYTGSFLSSGEIRLRMPGCEPEIYEENEVEGYVLRATLVEANYDIAPKLVTIEGFLFEVFQKETKCACHTFQKGNDVRVYSDMAEENFIRVYVKESKGSSYYLYRAGYEGAKGRYFDYKHYGHGQFEFIFDKDDHGYGPDKVKNAVRVLTYTEESQRMYRIGEVYGYDMQEVELPYQHICRDSFFLIAVRKDADGVDIYDFVRPEKKGEGELYYHLLENDGKIIIEDSGDYIGAGLLLGACAVSKGEAGNVRAGKYFKGDRLPDEVDFFNPGAGFGGRYLEDFVSMRERFLEDIKKSYVAVTAADYEELVSNTPGLCIKKVKAMMDEERNLVRIVIMPDTEEIYPKLSSIYEREILEQMEGRRLLTTRIQVESPKYVTINIKASICVKRALRSDAMDQIVNVIKREVDYRDSVHTFGEILKFDEVFRAIDLLECVEFIYDLSFSPANTRFAKIIDENVVPQDNVLCVLGDCDIELIGEDPI
ncbi:MAG: baseplate J/gp47 family protein, partial [Lachnospiraceae bacterium]|nr:baseplate J/gp47 family protein [Lachnospiraceae bacterium]